MSGPTTWKKPAEKAEAPRQAPAKPSLHQSQISMLLRCPKQYEWRYVKGIIAPPSVAQVAGTAVHEVVRADLSHRIETGELLPDEAVADLAAETLDATWDGEEPKLNPDEEAEGIQTVRGQAKDFAVACATTHHKQVAPGLRPTHVERTFRLELPTLPVDLVGTIDVLEDQRSHPGDRPLLVVRDTKTSRRKPPAEAAEKSEQLTVYGLAVRTLEGRDPQALALDYLVAQKRGTQAVTLLTQRSVEDYRALLELVGTAARLIESGLFLPAPRDPSAWICSERFCGWWRDCAYGERQRTSEAVPSIPV